MCRQPNRLPVAYTIWPPYAGLYREWSLVARRRPAVGTSRPKVPAAKGQMQHPNAPVCPGAPKPPPNPTKWRPGGCETDQVINLAVFTGPVVGNVIL